MPWCPLESRDTGNGAIGRDRQTWEDKSGKWGTREYIAGRAQIEAKVNLSPGGGSDNCAKNGFCGRHIVTSSAECRLITASE